MIENEELWTVELNLNDEAMSTCSWHIELYQQTVNRNINAAIRREERDPWLLVGITTSFSKAWDLCDQWRIKIYEERIKQEIPTEYPYGMEKVMNKWIDELEG